MQHGYDFIWKKFRAPFYVLPTGEKVKMTVRGNCPYILDDEIAVVPLRHRKGCQRGVRLLSNSCTLQPRPTKLKLPARRPK